MAVTCPGTSNPYFAPTKAGAEDAGAQLGIDMLWTGVPDGNTVNQLAQFQQLLNTGYEAIVVISFEPDAWIAPIKKAMADGVLVVTSNNDSPNSGRELYFGQDLVGAAVVQGQMLAKFAGSKGKVAMTNCAPGSLALDLRIKGAKEGVTKGGMTDVGVYNTNPADMASELGTMRDILRAHPDLAAMMPLCGPGHGGRGPRAQEPGPQASDRWHGPALPDAGIDPRRLHRRHGRPTALSARLHADHVRLSAGRPRRAEAGSARRQLLPGQRNRHQGECRPVSRARGTLPRMSDAERRPLLEATAISKRFGSIRALVDVSLKVGAGEVHGLIGANGAGKSTLIGILSGAVKPDRGALRVADKEVPLGSVSGRAGRRPRRRASGIDAVP